MKIALIGYGKMGQTIDHLALSQGHNITGRIDVENSNEMQHILSRSDVAIEFSHPSAAYDNLVKCIENGTPVVCGTTGWLEHLEDIHKLVRKNNGSYLYASNFSVGVNLFFALNEYLADIMSAYPEYKVQLSETHHTEKQDAPSGTAITLSKAIIDKGRYSDWHLKGDPGQPDILPIEAIREGKVFGKHRVAYQSPIDSINIEHDAHSREGFALGAITAAKYIMDKKGIFTMKDVLGL